MRKEGCFLAFPSPLDLWAYYEQVREIHTATVASAFTLLQRKLIVALFMS